MKYRNSSGGRIFICEWIMPYTRYGTSLLNKKCCGVIIFVAFLMTILLFQTATCEAETALIRMRFRPASDVLPMVKTMLSEEGRAAADDQSNTLIIVDTEESIGAVKDLLERIDKPGRMARIRLRFDETGSSQNQSIAVGGRISGNNWEISKGHRSKDGIDVRIEGNRRQQQGLSEYFIQVMSGRSAYILVGKKIPFREKWVVFSRRYAGFSEHISFQRIETGMEVRPVIMGDHADIEIMPRISDDIPGGKGRIIRFTEASTRISVPLGQWVQIGGADKSENEVVRAILAAGKGGGSAAVSISLMVESQ